ncbi:DUF4403 family protein [Hufsiella ginkgonis]|uniref:DUF4403 family protein n=1 Tax=Hufsiella ginkgonis TaxID=2695274 RepID=A0A7K1XWN8_9SPHI|nr:DUF4403 family protein [Hufsiella ginkgonis]MXV15395.1 DUF4403 family protein [Hufsiella ginkgonis]
MNQRLSFILILGAVLVSASCSTGSKILTLKPAPDYNNTQVVYDKQLSFVNLPVELSIADIQNQTNKYLNGVIYDDVSMDGDNMMLKVSKQAPIAIREESGRLYMDLPLKIWARVKYGIEKFGISAMDTRDFNLNGTIKLSTSAGLTNWKVTTNTTIEGIEWAESPSVTVMGKSVPITYLINPTLSVFKTKMAKIMDQTISQFVDIKPYVLSALEEMSKPTEVDPEYHTWFAIQPVELYATRSVIANKKITVNLGMKSYLETSVGAKPQLSFDKSKLVLKAVNTMPNEFNANIAGFVKYPDAAALMQKNFAGEKYESGGRAVTVNKVDLWGKDGKIVVQLGMSGSLNGDIYLSGFPIYNAATKEIYLDQVDFVLDSKNRLMKAGSWLVHGIIIKKIQQNCRFSILEQLIEGQKTMATYLNGYQPVKGVKVNGSMTELTPNKIFLTPNAIVAMVVAKGKVAISIDGME